jgi:quinol monooxygenase YgiN
MSTRGRRAGVILALLVASACASSPPAEPRAMFAGEGLRHVTAMTTADVAASSADAWCEALVSTTIQRLREADGNLAVFVLRRARPNEATIEVTIVSEWTSIDALEGCRRDAACGAQLLTPAATREFAVVFEANE